jgi:hypothetical protein
MGLQNLSGFSAAPQNRINRIMVIALGILQS